jgi:hypothetical protein
MGAPIQSHRWPRCDLPPEHSQWQRKCGKSKDGKSAGKRRTVVVTRRWVGMLGPAWWQFCRECLLRDPK